MFFMILLLTDFLFEPTSFISVRRVLQIYYHQNNQHYYNQIDEVVTAGIFFLQLRKWLNRLVQVHLAGIRGWLTQGHLASEEWFTQGHLADKAGYLSLSLMPNPTSYFQCPMKWPVHTPRPQPRTLDVNQSLNPTLAHHTLPSIWP